MLPELNNYGDINHFRRHASLYITNTRKFMHLRLIYSFRETTEEGRTNKQKGEENKDKKKSEILSP
jgi:hypothetical protein